MESLPDIKSAFIENAGYDLTPSVEEAKAFVKAGRQLLIMLPTLSEDERTSVRFSVEAIPDQLKAAIKWLAGQGEVDVDVVHDHTSVTFTDYRDYHGRGLR